MKAAYRWLLLLYPGRYRAQFGEEMLAVFDQAARERRDRGWAAFVAFGVREIVGLLRGAAVERAERPARLDAVAETHMRIQALVNRTVYAIAHHDFETARRSFDEERKEREKLLKRGREEW